jgi:hypothetical protein
VWNGRRREGRERTFLTSNRFFDTSAIDGSHRKSGRSLLFIQKGPLQTDAFRRLRKRVGCAVSEGRTSGSTTCSQASRGGTWVCCLCCLRASVCEWRSSHF